MVSITTSALSPCRLLVGCVAACSLTACNVTDPYATAFASVTSGDRCNQAITTLGAPSSTGIVEVAMFHANTLAWKVPFGKVYLLFCIADRVIGKSTIQ